MKDARGLFVRVAACNGARLAATAGRYVGFRPLTVAGEVLGHVREDRVGILEALGGACPNGLRVTADAVEVGSGARPSPEEVSTALAETGAALAVRGAARTPHGEKYPLVRQFGEDPRGVVDRTWAPWFGIRAFGVHVNGYCRDRGGAVWMWLAERSSDRRNWPGHLDQMAAGGLPAGLGPVENAVKELGEEAGVPRELAAAALQPVGSVSYVQEHALGLKPDTMFCFDLELPWEFEPTNTDGEVARFQRTALSEVLDMLAGDAMFKPNCALVALDFAVRHGHVSPTLPGYERLVAGLRRID